MHLFKRRKGKERPVRIISSSERDFSQGFFEGQRKAWMEKKNAVPEKVFENFDFLKAEDPKQVKKFLEGKDAFLGINFNEILSKARKAKSNVDQLNFLWAAINLAIAGFPEREINRVVDLAQNKIKDLKIRPLNEKTVEAIEKDIHFIKAFFSEEASQKISESLRAEALERKNREINEQGLLIDSLLKKRKFFQAGKLLLNQEKISRAESIIAGGEKLLSSLFASPPTSIEKFFSSFTGRKPLQRKFLNPVLERVALAFKEIALHQEKGSEKQKENFSKSFQFYSMAANKDEARKVFPLLENPDLKEFESMFEGSKNDFELKRRKAGGKE
ncbi:MAG TPA: hypothetical protein VJK05_02015 [archaeon]|nr:hypothetical protein [archaeon]